MSSFSSQPGAPRLPQTPHNPLSDVSSAFPRLAGSGGQQRYSCYIDPSVSVEDRVAATFAELLIHPDREQLIRSFLAPLRAKHAPTYQHCLRVGLLAREIASHEKLDQKALFFAGIMHDCGKALCPVGLLDKTDCWTSDDSHTMEQHVPHGHLLLAGKFDFTADVIALHHSFQEHPYPQIPIPRLHSYGRDTVEKIERCARILALADSFDALHRINCRHNGGAELSGDQIAELLVASNQDEQALIERLYASNVFTRAIFPSSKMH